MSGTGPSSGPPAFSDGVGDGGGGVGLGGCGWGEARSGLGLGRCGWGGLGGLRPGPGPAVGLVVWARGNMAGPTVTKGRSTTSQAKRSAKPVAITSTTTATFTRKPSRSRMSPLYNGVRTFYRL